MNPNYLAISLFLSISYFDKFYCKSPCNNENCVGPYKLSLPPMPKIKTNWMDKDAQIYYTDSREVIAFMGYRMRYRKHCYNGGSMDPNSGCAESLVGMAPDQDEIMKWYTRGQCSHGQICEAYGECWGWGSEPCYEESKDLDHTWTDSNDEPLPESENWMVFARHTCVQKWNCDHNKAAFPVFLTSKGNDVKPYIETETGEKIFMESTPTYYKDPAERFSLLIMEVPKVRYLQTKIHCSQTKQEESDFLCQLPQQKVPEEEKGIIVDIKDGESYEYNVFVRILNTTHHSGPESRKKSISFEDLAVLRDTLRYENRVTNHDLLAVVKEIQNVRQQVNIVIESVAKIDDELLGNLLKSQVKTKWFNKKLFYTCPCFDVSLNPYSNCAKGYIFSNGRLVKNSDLSKCTNIGVNMVKNISIFNNTDIYFAKLSIPPPEGTSSSWDGWSWVSEKRDAIVDSFIYTRDISMNKTSGLSFWGGQSYLHAFAWDIWGKISGLIGWIAFFMAAFALMRR